MNKIENDNQNENRKRIRIKINGSVQKTNKSIIFALSHIGMYDVEVVL